MDQHLAAKTCPECGSGEYTFRSRKKVVPEPGQEGPAPCGPLLFMTEGAAGLESRYPLRIIRTIRNMPAEQGICE